MKLRIKNDLGEQINIEVVKTHTIKQVLETLYTKNTLLREFITFRVYEKAVELSLDGRTLELEHTLADYGIDVLLNLIEKHNIVATSDLHLAILPNVAVPGLSTANLLNLRLESPEIPEELRCPLSTQVFRNPVRLPNGTLVEKAVIIKWVAEHGTCPYTRERLNLQSIKKLVPNLLKQAEVLVFLQQHEGCVYFPELQAEQYPENETIPQLPSQSPTVLPNVPDIDDLAAMDYAADPPNEIPQRDLRLLSYRLFSLWSRDDDEEKPYNIVNNSTERMLLHPSNYSEMPTDSWNAEEQERRCIFRTLEELREHGVTEELIRENWFPNQPHLRWGANSEDNALIYLVTGRSPESLTFSNRPVPLSEVSRLRPVAALREITSLNYHSLKVLCRLYSYGLRGEDLRTWNATNPEQTFDEQYVDILVELVIRRNQPVDIALAGLNDHINSEARDFSY